MTKAKRYTGKQAKLERFIKVQFLTLNYTGEGLEGTEEFSVEWKRGPETQMTGNVEMKGNKARMSNTFERESGFWFNKDENVQDKFCDFTLLINGNKGQKVQFNLSPLEGKYDAPEDIVFDKHFITMKVLITVCDPDQKDRQGAAGGCCIVF